MKVRRMTQFFCTHQYQITGLARGERDILHRWIYSWISADFFKPKRINRGKRNPVSVYSFLQVVWSGYIQYISKDLMAWQNISPVGIFLFYFFRWRIPHKNKMNTTFGRITWDKWCINARVNATTRFNRWGKLMGPVVKGEQSQQQERETLTKGP